MSKLKAKIPIDDHKRSDQNVSYMAEPQLVFRAAFLSLRFLPIRDPNFESGFEDSSGLGLSTESRLLFGEEAGFSSSRLSATFSRGFCISEPVCLAKSQISSLH